MKTRHLLILSALIVALLAGGSSLWVWQAKRQYVLNRELIAALVHGDSKQALALVTAGADPNTRLEPLPAPSWRELMNQVLHPSQPPVNDSSTALMLACGDPHFAGTLDEDSPSTLNEEEAYEKWHASAEKWYKSTGNLDLIKAMVLRKVDVNARDNYNMTALHCAVQSKRSLSVIKQLLVYGADPNIPENNGTLAIDIAENENRFDLVALLRRGAK